MVTNNAANIATGASGTILRGAGVGTAPTFSTATYPDTAGTSGNVLTSNGTNWTSAAPSGSSVVVKQVRTSTTASDSTNVAIPYDNTIPQSGEGKQLFTLSITPANASNILLIEASVNLSTDTVNPGVLALFQDAGADAIGISTSYTTSTAIGAWYFRYYKTAGTTSSTTFNLRYGCGSGSIFVNSQAGTAKYNSTMFSSFSITELTP